MAHVQVGKSANKAQSWVVLLSLVLILVLAACGGTTPAAEVPAAAVEATTVVEPTEAPAEATEAPEEEVAEEATVESTDEEPEEATGEEAEATEVPAEEATGATGSVTFIIDPAQSEARFTLSEILMGSPTTVVGRGNGISGDLTVNFDDYSQSSISPIVIDASLLATDNNMRNGQIRRAILETNNPDYQFITFTPTAVEGFPESATVGEPFDISVTGDLTIRETTQPLTFEVTVTPLSESEIQGSARATLLREDFDLQIPSVPSVADVSEDVLLEFDFVANAE